MSVSCEDVLREFVETIEATGGVTQNEQGFYVPMGDPEWVDLGEVYAKACQALDVPMKIT